MLVNIGADTISCQTGIFYKYKARTNGHLVQAAMLWVKLYLVLKQNRRSVPSTSMSQRSNRLSC